eukprot:CAMPEP_0196587292 /NCGR_PEP_ID=MMETSP1081-20130531/57032_1 /TAXON_ID=36882 /ORGANISM="Pyramimonas amylifera, Strain CCMP720" /LENGTH=88 /DNA_ID=CAMNT_0041909439 /DNA_START=554 /DNA_END=816 /DNA_ORIENTATION=+
MERLGHLQMKLGHLETFLFRHQDVAAVIEQLLAHVYLGPLERFPGWVLAAGEGAQEAGLEDLKHALGVQELLSVAKNKFPEDRLEKRR